MIDYLDAFQCMLALMVIIGLGYLCTGLKIFTADDALALCRAIFLIPMPALFFRQVGLQKLSLEGWHSFLNEVLVQVTIHLLLAAVCFAIPARSKKLEYMKALFSSAYSNFIFFGTPITQVLFGDTYMHIPAMMNIVQFFFVIPWHTYLIWKWAKEENEAKAAKGSDEKSRDHEEDVVEDGEDKGDGGPIEPIEGDTGNDVEPGAEETPAEEDTDEPTSVKKNKCQECCARCDKPTRFWAVFWAIVCPSNVCTVLGIIWAATGWTMPMYVNSTAQYLEKAVMAAGLFSIGVFMWGEKFCGFNLPAVIIHMFIHFLVNPLISWFWCWVVGMDKKNAMLCVLAHAMPPAMTGYMMAVSCGYGMRTAAYTFFWSNLVCMAPLMLWIIVINELEPFGEQFSL